MKKFQGHFMHFQKVWASFDTRLLKRIFKIKYCIRCNIKEIRINFNIKAFGEIYVWEIPDPFW